MGKSVEQALRGSQCELLGPSFKYEVLRVFGVNGRAIAFRPCHAPQTLVLAFRGTRVDMAAAATRSREVSPAGRAASSPPSEDVKALLNSSMVSAAWLPDPAMRVHAGVLGHHQDLWDGGHSQRGSSDLAALGDWIASDVAPNPPANILFVGLSLGAALAQMSALRLAAQYPALAARSAVWGLGALQFANAAVASHYAATFGARSAQCVTTRRMPDRPPPQVTWWVKDTSDAAVAEVELQFAAAAVAATAGHYRAAGGMATRSGDGVVSRGSSGSRCASERDSLASRVSAAEMALRGDSDGLWFAVDPITAAYANTVPLHNVFSMPVDAADVESGGASDGCDGGPTGAVGEAGCQLPLRRPPSREGGLAAPPSALAALMSGRIAAQHALRLDYLALHLSRHYRAALREAYVGHLVAERAGEVEPPVGRQTSAGFKRSRAPTMEHATARMASADEDEALFGYGPLAVSSAQGAEAAGDNALRRTRSKGQPESVELRSGATLSPEAKEGAREGAREGAAVAAADVPRRSARIGRLMKSVMRAGWGVRLTHRLRKEARMVNTLDLKFSDLAAVQALAQPAAPPDLPAPRQSMIRRRSVLPPRLSEDLSYYGF